MGLKRVLGLGSYQTAWSWLHKMRRAMVRPGRDKLHGIVEVDETLVGGEAKGSRKIYTTLIEANIFIMRAAIKSVATINGFITNKNTTKSI